MYSLRSVWNAINNAGFKNIDHLGVFLENHDNPRFMNLYNNKSRFLAALAFTFMARGIPVFYYGGEQYFKGPQDPGCREPLWTTGYKVTDAYNVIS
jgi:alpha-amylase